MMASAFMPKMPMPLPNLNEEEKRDIASVLITRFPAKEEDDEKLAQLKLDVDYAKKEMAKFIGDGGDPNDFLQYYYQQLDKAYEYRDAVLKQLHKIDNEGDKDLAKEFCGRVNEILREKGIKEVDFKEECDDDSEDAEESVNANNEKE